MSTLGSPGGASPGRVRELARRATDSPGTFPGRARGSTFVGDGTDERPRTPLAREIVKEFEEVSPRTVVKESPARERLKGKGMKRTNTAPQ